MSFNIFLQRNMHKVVWSLGLMVPVLFSQGFSAKIAVPLFLFSGQSNMVCLGSANSDLPAADKSKTYDNVKIHNRSDQASSKWSTLKPGFGADANHFGSELYFGKALMDSMPNTKFAFVKDATSGTYLGKDSPQAPGWLPPSSGGPGGLYKNMMTHIDNALKSFNEAYDTSKYEPKWAGFVWLQGEFDGWNDQTLANKYETNLTNLIKDIRTMAKADSLPVVIIMISGSSWQYLNTINTAEIAVAKKIVNVDTMSTKNFAFASDNVHFNAASQIKIGTISAQRWLAMKYLDVVVPIINVPVKTVLSVSSISKNVTSYDLTGRRIVQLPAGVLESKPDRPTLMIINVDGTRAEKVLPVNVK